MAVAAVSQLNPSNLFQTPVSNAAGSQRLDTKVSAISAATDLTGRLSVTTAEGDTITLTADFEARYRAVNYQGQSQTDAGTAQVSAKSVEASLKQQYGVTVEGDLNEQELNDLEKLFRKVGNIFRKFFRGQDDEALAKTAKLADRFGNLSSLSGLDLSVSVERSVTVVAAQVASSVTGQPAVPTGQTPTVTTFPATPATPGAAPSTAAAIPPSSTGTTAPTQPSTASAAPAADSTTRLVVPAPDASATKSLVQQVLDALEEAKVESQKVRKYLPDFLRKLREELESELRASREQAVEPATDTHSEPPASTVSSVVFAYQSVRQTSVSLSIRS